MPRVLVVANRTVAGRGVLDAVRERHEQGGYEFHLVVPLTRPAHGNVIYDDAARGSAQVRVDLVVAYLARLGIEVTGEIGDEDPYTATMDALATFPADEIIVSTLPQTRSGWLRRDLVDRIGDDAGVPVHHVVTDPASEGLAVGVTLVVANRTAGGDELMELLRKDAEQEDRIFIVVVPLEGKDGESTEVARDRLTKFIARLRENGIVASGMIGDPDPYDATMNAVQFFHISDIVISTLPRDESKWMADKLVERVSNATNKPVEHIESTPERVES
jgi:hypothetical protein